MGKLERITVTLSEELVATVRAAVDEGSYASTSEVVREALRDWHARQLDELRSVQELRAMIRQAETSPTVDGDEFMDELRDRVAAEVARRAL